MSDIKKKRVSKKTKLSWRKHVNINDVEDFLEEQRLEARMGKPLSTVTNNELFKIDTKADAVLSDKQRKKLRLQLPPKCFSMLQAHTNVPDPITKRNHVKTKEERKNDVLKKKEAGRKQMGILKSKSLQSLKDRRINALKRSTNTKKNTFHKDVWAAEEKTRLESNGWVSAGTKRHTLSGLGKLRKAPPKSLSKKKSILPSVELPHPGTSYNPSFDDHQDLIKQIVKKELQIIKDEKHINRVTTGMFKKVQVKDRDNTWLVEMSEGINKPNDKLETAVEDESGDAINPISVINKKKTLQQRRKQKEQIALETAKQKAKIEKKKVADLHKIKVIAKSIDKREAKAKMLGEKRAKVAKYKLKEAKRLSGKKFEEPDMDFNMGQDITGRLLNMKKEGSILTDRFKSLQKRNILEPSVQRHVKRGKIKRFKRSGHKDDWKGTVAGLKKSS